MRRNLLFLGMLITAILSFAEDIPVGYIDLGLPSGTHWKAVDEPGYYTYPSARYYFGDALPNKAQVEELLYNCTWKWTGKGYKVTGPNQNSIYFPFNGYQDCDEVLHLHGSAAMLWTLDNAGVNFAYYYVLSDQQRTILEDSNCRGCSVRLVINE